MKTIKLGRSSGNEQARRMRIAGKMWRTMSEREKKRLGPWRVFVTKILTDGPSGLDLYGLKFHSRPLWTERNDDGGNGRG